MITEVQTEEICFVSQKIQEIINLAQEVSRFDQGYIYLLDVADRLLITCRERIKNDAQKIDESAR